MNKNPRLVQLGVRIRQLRKDRGYSQEEFANLSHISRAFYGRIERGERNVSVLNVIKIAEALKVSVGDLFPSSDSSSTHEI